MRARYYMVTTGDPWIDIGEGECQRCLIARRLYRPIKRLDIYVCAPCASVITNASRSDDDPPPDTEPEAKDLQ